MFGFRTMIQLMGACEALLLSSVVPPQSQLHTTNTTKDFICCERRKASSNSPSDPHRSKGKIQVHFQVEQLMSQLDLLTSEQ